MLNNNTLAHGWGASKDDRQWVLRHVEDLDHSSQYSVRLDLDVAEQFCVLKRLLWRIWLHIDYGCKNIDV